MYENLTEEGSVVQIASGPVYITLRQPSPLTTQGQRRGHAWSDDDGYSWSRIQFDDALPDPHVEGSIIRIPATGGGSKDRFLLSSLATVSEAFVDRSQLTVRLSEDDLKSWAFSKVLCEGSSGYSDLALADDNTILCLFETDHVSKIVLARFNLAWLIEEED
jgi:sialidase-1